VEVGADPGDEVDAAEGADVVAGDSRRSTKTAIIMARRSIQEKKVEAERLRLQVLGILRTGYGVSARPLRPPKLIPS
jgi:hypothetical protein